mgnify:CR=1 FL=1|jgi:hypothetical protein
MGRGKTAKCYYCLIDLMLDKRYENVTKQQVRSICGMSENSIAVYVRNQRTYHKRWKIERTTELPTNTVDERFAMKWDEVTGWFRNTRQHNREEYR